MILCVIQARVESSRLPGKVLLPVGKRPAVVLATERAANLGAKIMVATSENPSDDVLAGVLADYHLSFVRGPLEDVLKRFVIATSNLPEKAVVIRLTADNIFPDGTFIDELAKTLVQSHRQYLGTSSPADGLPYGLSAEAFTIRALRAADSNATTAYDREHVTTWMRRKFPGDPFRPKNQNQDLSYLRCTIDNIDDFQRVARVFSKVEDPVKILWRELCQILQRDSPHPMIGKRSVGTLRIGELVLGTAQIGLSSYGRTNTIGHPDSSTAIELVQTAVQHGVDCIDTARAYDQAERVIGNSLKPFGDRISVVTKLSPLVNLPEDADRNEIHAAVDASVFRSCKELKMTSLPVLLLHRWNHRTSHKGAVWERLLELKAEKVIGKLGASVSSPDEAKEALNDSVVEHLQIPVNLLDYRWETAGIPQMAVQRSDVVVHARSVFLQGILAGQSESWPRIEAIDPVQLVAAIETLAEKLGRVSRADLCLAFVRAQPWIHGFVLGVESMSQFKDIVSLFQRPALQADEQECVRRAFPQMSATLLNPALWPSL